MKKVIQRSVFHFAVLTSLLFGGIQAHATDPAPTPSQANFEVRFLTEMIDHHAMAVMMAMLCDRRVEHTELLDLCHSIVETQSAQIELMQRWLGDWYGISHEPEMTPGDERMMEKLAELSGEEFEIEFMSMMIKHHSRAVKEGMHCLDKAYHPELIDLCQNIVTSQLAEIELMQTWLCDWYGICHYSGR